MSESTRPRDREAIPGWHEYLYCDWSFEELQSFAKQLQVPGATSKNRFELIEILGGPRGHTGSAPPHSWLP